MTPNLGKGPHPKTRKRPITVFSPTAPMVTNMGVFESFNDRKVAVLTALMTIMGAAAEKQLEINRACLHEFIWCSN
jgi:hypothetical protein